VAQSIREMLETGVRLQSSGRLDEAEKIYRDLLTQHPNHPDALHLSGAVRLQRNQVNEAIELIERAIGINATIPQYHNTMGMAYWAAGRSGLAIDCFRRAIAISDTMVVAHSNLANLLRDTGHIPAAIPHYRRTIELAPQNPAYHAALLGALHYIDGPTPQEIFEEHVRWAHRHADPLVAGAAPHANPRDPDRRLRIGYISPDLWNHVVARFLLPALEHRDRRQIEVFCYADVKTPDEITQRIRRASDHWRDIAPLADVQTAKLIRRDKIDILVDLAGQTAFSRLRVLAYKPAPVQVTWQGYPNTTGMKAVDYRLTDAMADPPGQTEQWHIERLVRLPTAWCYQPIDDAPIRPGPSQRGEPFTFGSFNNLLKLTDSMLTLWATLLHRVPGSRLLLKAQALSDSYARNRVERIFADRQIAPDRLIIRGAEPEHAKHLSMYADMDLALDSYPYHGTTTTVEALWMGVPVITLAGPSHVSRVGASLLHSAGLDDFVTNSRDEYLALAIKTSQNRPLLAELRRTLRDRLQQSPLLDAPAFAQSIEAAYRAMWREWCEKRVSP
jgi:predicted O-linked N-acetylglucosamine transferase (SPINDLY family)